MKTSNFIVRVPEPCHEDWNSMQPDAKGKFCNSCSKSVFDFSNKTDAEIKDILLEYKDQKVCGHFKKSQVNRPLNISINFKDLPKNISMTKAFAIALFLVFGTFLFSCTDEHGQKVGKIEVVETKPQSQRYMLGMMSIDIPPPTIDSITQLTETISGDIESVYIEGNVAGGISFEEVNPEEIVVMDTVVKEEPAPENFVVGMMVMSYPVIDKTDTISKDSSDINNTRRIETTEAINKTTNFVIYPNPSNGEFTITYDVIKRMNVVVNIIDLKGLLIKNVVDITNQYEGKYKIPVNLSDLPNGIYLVNLIMGNKKFVERLVIER